MVAGLFANMYGYIERHIDRSQPKEHVGYIVDRTGYVVFRDEVLDGIQLGAKARVAAFMDFGGYFTSRSNVIFSS